MAEKGTTTIRIYENDRQRLSALGVFGESFADVLARVLDEREEMKLREREKQNPHRAVCIPALA